MTGPARRWAALAALSCVAFVSPAHAQASAATGPSLAVPQTPKAPVIDGKLERTMCRQVGDAALLVGVFVTPGDTKRASDMKPIRPLLDALAKAAEAAQ